MKNFLIVVLAVATFALLGKIGEAEQNARREHDRRLQAEKILTGAQQAWASEREAITGIRGLPNGCLIDAINSKAVLDAHKTMANLSESRILVVIGKDTQFGLKWGHAVLIYRVSTRVSTRVWAYDSNGSIQLSAGDFPQDPRAVALQLYGERVVSAGWNTP